jgi:hypothetical protein
MEGLDGLYPVLDNPAFDTFVRCNAGMVDGDVQKCHAGLRFSFGWQKCINATYVVALDESEFHSMPVTVCTPGDTDTSGFACLHSQKQHTEHTMYNAAQRAQRVKFRAHRC